MKSKQIRHFSPIINFSPEQTEQIRTDLGKNRTRINIFNFLAKLFWVLRLLFTAKVSELLKMKDRLEVIESRNLSGYVSSMKDNIKRKYTHFKIKKFRESYRDGLQFEENAEYEKAIQCYLECLEMETDNIKCLYRLANLYSNLEENSKALEFFYKITKLNPNEETYFHLGQEFYKQNRFKKQFNV